MIAILDQAHCGDKQPSIPSVGAFEVASFSPFAQCVSGSEAAAHPLSAILRVRQGWVLCRFGVTWRSRLLQPWSGSLCCRTPPGLARADCSRPDSRRGRRRQTHPRGAIACGNAVATAVSGKGSARRRPLPLPISGRFRTTGRRKLWRATTMPGAVSMDRQHRRITGNAG
jgi:hypothetical protein